RRALAGAAPEDERSEQGGERDDEGRALRTGVGEPRVRKQVEAGEPERAEPEQAQAAAVEAERSPAFHDRENDQPEACCARVSDGREREGADAVERRLADHELAAPR